MRLSPYHSDFLSVCCFVLQLCMTACLNNLPHLPTSGQEQVLVFSSQGIAPVDPGLDLGAGVLEEYGATSAMAKPLTGKFGFGGSHIYFYVKKKNINLSTMKKETT